MICAVCGGVLAQEVIHKALGVVALTIGGMWGLSRLKIGTR